METRKRTILGGLGGLLTGVGLAWPLLVPSSSTLVKVGPLIGLVILGIAMMVAAFRQPRAREEGRLELFLAARKIAAEAAEVAEQAEKAVGADPAALPEDLTDRGAAGPQELPEL